jgi:hypothetical protein
MVKIASHKSPEHPGLRYLIHTIVRGDEPEVTKLLRTSPLLAREPLTAGATREAATDFYFKKLNHYLSARTLHCTRLLQDTEEI